MNMTITISSSGKYSPVDPYPLRSAGSIRKTLCCATVRFCCSAKRVGRRFKGNGIAISGVKTHHVGDDHVRDFGSYDLA